MKPCLKFCFAIFTGLLVIPVYGQTPLQLTVSNASTDVELCDRDVSSDNSYYTVGNYTSMSSPQEVYMTRHDGTGNTLWEKTLSTPGFIKYVNGVSAASDGCYVCGKADAQSGIGDHAYITKLSVSGVVVWERRLDTLSLPNLYQVTTTADGGCIAVGTGYAVSQKPVAIAVRLDSSGNTLWMRTYRGGDFDIYTFVNVIADGLSNFYVCGRAFNYWTQPSFALLTKLDPNGNPIWSYAYSQSNFYYNFSDLAFQGSSIIATGTKANNFAADYANLVVARITSNGMCTALTCVGDTTGQYAAGSVCLTPSNSIVVAGALTDSNGGATLIEFDVSLNFTRGIHNSSLLFFSSFIMDANGNSTFCGWDSNPVTGFFEGNTDYTWSIGCGFQSLTDTTYSVQISHYPFVFDDTATSILVPGVSTTSLVDIARTSCYNPVGIEEPSVIELHIFPNPASGSVTLEIGLSRATHETVFIFNSLGAIVYASDIPPGTDRIEISTAGFSSGIYFVNLSGGEKTKLEIINE